MSSPNLHMSYIKNTPSYLKLSRLSNLRTEQNEHHFPDAIFRCILSIKISCVPLRYLYYNYEKYPLSPLKPRSLALIEQYPPNISDPVYSVHQSFMWFLWLHWRKSTFYPVTTPNDDLLWRHRYKSRSPAIVTSQWPIVPARLLWTLS